MHRKLDEDKPESLIVLSTQVHINLLQTNLDLQYLIKYRVVTE